MTSQQAIINRMIQLEIQVIGGAPTQQQLEEIRGRVTKLVGGFKDFNDVIGKTTSALIRGVDGFKSLAGSITGVDLGLMAGVTNLDKYNKALLGTSSQFAKYGIGIKSLENSISSLSARFGINKDDMMDLMSTYEKGFAFPSLNGGIKLLENLRKMVGNNVSAMKEWEQTLGSLTSQFPELQSHIENLGESDKKYLKTMAQVLLMTKQITTEKAKQMVEYANGNKQLNPADEERKKEVQAQIEAITNLQRVLDNLAKDIGTKIIPLFEATSTWINKNKSAIESWEGAIAKIIITVGVLGTALKGIQAMKLLTANIAGSTASASSSGMANSAGRFVGQNGGVIGSIANAGKGAAGAYMINGVVDAAKPSINDATNAALGGLGVDTKGSGWGNSVANSTAASIETSTKYLGSIALGFATGGPIGAIAAGVTILAMKATETIYAGGAMLDAQKDAKHADRQADNKISKFAQYKLDRDDAIRKDPNTSKAEKDLSNFDDERARLQQQMNELRSTMGTGTLNVAGSIGGSKSFEDEKADGKKHLAAWQFSNDTKVKQYYEMMQKMRQIDKEDKAARDAVDKQAKTGSLYRSPEQKAREANAAKEATKAAAANNQKEEERKSNEINKSLGEDFDIGRTGQQSAGIEAGQGVFQAQSQKLDALIAKAQNSTSVDMAGIVEARDAALKTLDTVYGERQKYLKELESKNTALLNQNKTDMKAAAEELSKHGIDPSDKDAGKKIANMSAGSGKDDAYAALQKYQQSSMAYNVTARNNEKAISELQSLQVQKSNQKLEANNKLKDSYQGQINMANELVRIAQIEVELTNAMGVGFHASADAVMNQSRAIDGVISGLKEQLKITHDNLANAEKMAQTGNEDEKKEAQSQLLKYMNEEKKLNNDITGQKLEQAKLLKTIRDGYVSAMSAATIGTGMIGKFIIDQNKGLGIGVKYLGVIKSMSSGGVGDGKGSVGAREASGFETGTGKLYGPKDRHMWQTYDGGAKLANEVRGKTADLYQSAGGTLKNGADIFATSSKYLADRIDAGKAGGGSNAAIGANPSYPGRVAEPNIGTLLQNPPKSMIPSGTATNTPESPPPTSGSPKKSSGGITIDSFSVMFDDLNILGNKLREKIATEFEKNSGFGLSTSNGQYRDY